MPGIEVVNEAPFEVIAGPAHVWIADVGEPFPLIDADVDVSTGHWTYIGYTSGGVQVSHPQTVKDIEVDQVITPVKTVRPSEQLNVTFTMATLTIENIGRVLNNAAVTAHAAGSGVAGYKEINLYRGYVMVHTAMVVRGPSAYMDAFSQYQIPVITQVGTPQLGFVRDDKAGMSTEWRAIADPNAATILESFGKLLMQTEAAL